MPGKKKSQKNDTFGWWSICCGGVIFCPVAIQALIQSPAGGVGLQGVKDGMISAFLSEKNKAGASAGVTGSPPQADV